MTPQELADGAVKKHRDPMGWARELRRREEAGEKLSVFAATAWRHALRREISAEIEAKRDEWE